MKTKKILTIIVIAILVIGGILYFNTRKSSDFSKLHTKPSTLIQNPENISTTTEISTISIPPLPPFMDWTSDISSKPQNIVFYSQPATAYSQYIINLATSLSMPKDFIGDFPPVSAKKWTGVVKQQSGESASLILSQFRNYYDSILTKNKWLYESIDISSTTINGAADDGTFSSHWSYLKSDGINLYMIVLGYSGNIYEVDVSDPIPLKQLGL